MVTIKGEKVYLESLNLLNVYEMRNWGKYEDPLFDDYNFPELEDFEIKRWFDIKTSQKDCESFGVLNEDGRTIGFISIKDIRKLLKTANLGIAFDSRYINKGYGTNALKALLKYYFDSMNMRTMYLDVAKHNVRAIKCYEKCGFKIVKEYTMKNNDINLNDIQLKDTKSYFIIKKDTLYGYYYKMRLGKNDYKDFLFT